MIYVLATVIIYFNVVGLAFQIRKQEKQSLLLMAYLLSPLVIAILSVFLIQNVFNGMPSLNIPQNIYFSAISIIGTLVLSFWFIWHQKLHKFNEGNI